MDTENRTSRKRNAFATALLTTLAFALGFAEFVLIGITPDVAEGLGEPLTLIGDLVGYYALACAVATPIVALATARADRFKVMAALLVVFNAFAEWHHYESKSRGLEDTPEKVARFNREIATFEKKWPEILKNGDPYYNPNLTLKSQDFSLKRI